jgi:hypothetical protein
LRFINSSKDLPEQVGVLLEAGRIHTNRIAQNISYSKCYFAARPYFESNAERMGYPDFRRRGLFVGTGVLEAGCKTVVGSRLKQSGMFWTVRGANAIIALRCCQLSGEFEDYWEARHA